MSIAAELTGGFSGARVFALVRRYVYLLRASWPRLLELIYWPAVQMVTWGFLQTYVMQTSNAVAFGAGVFIGGMLLWDLLFRSQLGFSMSFLEEMWARNMGNLLMSPLRPLEFVAALMVMSLVRLALGLGPVALLAIQSALNRLTLKTETARSTRSIANWTSPASNTSARARSRALRSRTG